MTSLELHIPDCPLEIYVIRIEPGERGTRRIREDAAVAALIEYRFGAGAARAHRPDGAPYIPGADAAISISHSKSYAVLAVGPSESMPGIDIEDNRAQLPRVCRRILSDEEYARFAPDRFAEAWTKKEALYKASRSLFDHETDYRLDLRIFPVAEAAGVEFRTAVFNLEGGTCGAAVWHSLPTA